MSLLQEFKAFALRGNVVDMAVGVIMGGAFGKIVTSIVNDILMPPIGKLTGSNVNFKDRYLDLNQLLSGVDGIKNAVAAPRKSLADAIKDGDPIIAYGNFLSTVIDFTIIAICIFLMVKAMNYVMKKKEAAPAAPPEPPADVKLLTEIRDLLKSQATR